MSSQSPAAPRALVVEDDPSIRALLGPVLLEEGYRVMLSDHAPDPVDVQQLRPDVIVLDLVLDGADGGWSLLRALRANPGTARIPIVVCTADRSRVLQAAGEMRDLAAQVVLKPFDLEDLLRHLGACCGHTERGDGRDRADGVPPHSSTVAATAGHDLLHPDHPPFGLRPIADLPTPDDGPMLAT